MTVKTQYSSWLGVCFENQFTIHTEPKAALLSSILSENKTPTSKLRSPWFSNTGPENHKDLFSAVSRGLACLRWWPSCPLERRKPRGVEWLIHKVPSSPKIYNSLTCQFQDLPRCPTFLTGETNFLLGVPLEKGQDSVYSKDSFLFSCDCIVGKFVRKLDAKSVPFLKQM